MEVLVPREASKHSGGDLGSLDSSLHMERGDPLQSHIFRIMVVCGSGRAGLRRFESEEPSFKSFLALPFVKHMTLGEAFHPI